MQYARTPSTQAPLVRGKGISESRAIQGLGVFHGGDKGYYKEWHAKFVNVFKQVRRGPRDILRHMEGLDEEWTMD
eukprot:4845449-Alexandrium_andersonii.AAC.1